MYSFFKASLSTKKSAVKNQSIIIYVGDLGDCGFHMVDPLSIRTEPQQTAPSCKASLSV